MSSDWLKTATEKHRLGIVFMHGVGIFHVHLIFHTTNVKSETSMEKFQLRQVRWYEAMLEFQMMFPYTSKHCCSVALTRKIPIQNGNQNGVEQWVRGCADHLFANKITVIDHDGVDQLHLAAFSESTLSRLIFAFLATHVTWNLDVALTSTRAALACRPFVTECFIEWPLVEACHMASGGKKSSCAWNLHDDVTWLAPSCLVAPDELNWI